MIGDRRVRMLLYLPQTCLPQSSSSSICLLVQSNTIQSQFYGQDHPDTVHICIPATKGKHE
jgi:hypothetical protein